MGGGGFPLGIQSHVTVKFKIMYENKNNIIIIIGAKGDWDFWISDLVKTPDETDI